MTNLSTRARALLEALTAWGPHHESLLPTLGAQNEPTLVLPLFRKLFSASEDKARALAIALHHLLSHLGPEDVRGLDESLRQVSFYETDYVLLRPQELEHFAALSPSVATLLTSHPSGYLRQAALLHLLRSGNVDAWPFLLLRLNDWVLPVREAAHEAATAALPEPAPEAIPGQAHRQARSLPPQNMRGNSAETDWPPVPVRPSNCPEIGQWLFIPR
ncbi:hypothetical protein KYC5002_10220 [Archangium violaceum]|uniref:hypothetical protein n=1 Tax=Archangium violaceum TaxID=83451 RepID=UPI002B283BAD|nr:hypothetical protein KYC5002_10220 [Archangium gephyra]